MKHIGLFEGIGGFSLAARWMGWNTIAWCEINPFGQQVLKHHFPNAKGHSDIKTTDFSIYRGKCDILTGGFPCQPYSTAGKRLGKEDDRHLWPEMLRAVREISPRWILGENVRGLTNWNGGMVFDEVQADLENEGYEVTPFLLPACAVNAPHRRDRIWFVAYSGGNGRVQRSTGNESYEFGERSEGKRGWDILTNEFNSDCDFFNGERLATNSDSQQRCKGRLYQTRPGETERHTSSRDTWNDRGAWEKFPTQSPICFRDDELSNRLSGITFSKWRQESIKALGNAIVPQVALQIFKAIEQYESTLNHE